MKLFCPSIRFLEPIRVTSIIPAPFSTTFLSFYFSSSKFQLQPVMSRLPPFTADAMERLENNPSGDSFQPFRGLSPNCGTATLLLFYFLISSPFSAVPFFSVVFRGRAPAHVCGGGCFIVIPPSPLHHRRRRHHQSLFVYQSLLQATVTTQSC